MTDDELIAWFADLELSDPVPDVPEPGLEMRRRVERLVELSLMPAPDDADGFVDIVLRARDACRRHPVGRRADVRRG